MSDKVRLLKTMDRVTELERQLASVQQQLVTVCASQIQALFSSPVMVDSLAARFFSAAANALHYKANASTERAPELVVIEGYVPGSLRAILNEDGSATVDQQLKGATNAGGAWESATQEYAEKGVMETFTQLLAAYGAEANRVYYITDSVTLSTHREKIARELAQTQEVVAGEEDEANPQSPETPATPDAVEFDLRDGEVTRSVTIGNDWLQEVTRGEEPVTILAASDIIDGDVLFLMEDEVRTGWTVVTTRPAYLPPVGVDGEPEPEAIDGPYLADYLVHVTEEGVLENGLIIPSTATVQVTRGEETADLLPVAMVEGDKFVYVPADGLSNVTYSGTVKSIEELPSDLDDVPPVDDAPDASAYEEGTSVRLITKPWSLEHNGSVDVAGDEYTSFVGLYEDVITQVDGAEVIKDGRHLAIGDRLVVTRNAAVWHEVVVSVEIDVFTQDPEPALVGDATGDAVAQ